MYGHAVLAGNLGADPEKRETKGGGKFATFRLAVNLGMKDDPATWFDISVFNERSAKFVMQHVKKGSSVVVSGRIRPNEYQNKEGATVREFAIVAEDVNFISTGGGKKDGDEGQSTEQSESFGAGPAAGGDDADW